MMYRVSRWRGRLSVASCTQNFSGRNLADLEKSQPVAASEAEVTKKELESVIEAALSETVPGGYCSSDKAEQGARQWRAGRWRKRKGLEGKAHVSSSRSRPSQIECCARRSRSSYLSRQKADRAVAAIAEQLVNRKV
jgi:hypothetical protein